MEHLPGILIHVFTTAGFLLALVLLARILTQRRSPTSTLAWLMAVVLVPYVGVPLYLLLGGRKVSRRMAAKQKIRPAAPVLPADEGLEHQLASLGFRGGFAPTRRNRLGLLLRGEEAYAATLRLISRAQEAIHVATFILGRDPTGRAVIAALAAKARRGVPVYLLLDALGSVKIDRRFLAPLTSAGGRVAFFMPMLHLPFRGRANLRNHRKMVVVDGQTAIVGGMNLAREYMGPRASQAHWQDLSLEIRGPAAEQALEIFRLDWQFAAQEEIGRWRPNPGSADDTASTALQFIASGPDTEGDALREALMISLFRAAQRVWITTPYFVPDDALLDALCMAARRGIDLRLVLPRRSNHRLADLARESYLSQLQEAGARILLYRPRMLHAKAMLIDDRVAVTGSANLDMRSLLLNYEMALCIYSPEIIRELEDWMRQLMADCGERRPHTSPSLAVLEGIGRLFAPLL
jgi:cardiolipin synthase